MLLHFHVNTEAVIFVREEILEKVDFRLFVNLSKAKLPELSLLQYKPHTKLLPIFNTMLRLYLF